MIREWSERRGALIAAALAAAAWACAPAPADPGAAAGARPDQVQPFLDSANARLLELSNALGRAQWVAANFITEDTERISADALTAYVAATMELAADAARFDRVEASADQRRQLTLLKLSSIPLPAPGDPEKRAELTSIMTSLEGDYGRGKYCPPSRPCQDINALGRTMGESRNPDELLEAWRGWHAISPPMRARYQRFIELANEGARELGYADLGALWRSNYDMTPEAFSAETERLWGQLKPLYDSLHAHVRASLSRRYGPKVAPDGGLIPAHLLGNMWAQQWGNIYAIAGPPTRGSGYDLTALLKAKRVDAREMVRYGERFFTSLGFEPLPETFWTRSLFVKPQDREVVCHASAWDVDNDADLRIKMCIQITGEDFVVIHHELGHNFYQRAYRGQPVIYRSGANDGFHEAIGDAVALSVTPGYLVKVGLLPRAPGPEGDLEFLMRMALDKAAFIPFGLVVDQWRFRAFSGQAPPDRWNAEWWDLRRKYQGVAAPVARSEADFDPGAKYHVPGNTPYMRYFLAHVLQFQFHRALCRASGHNGPLHTCSIYGDKAAGERLKSMLALGQSRPWPEALAALTGEKQMDASAMLDYFAPLKAWLDEQNKGRNVGY
jgi:peptidyl-dipeptidase A